METERAARVEAEKGRRKAEGELAVHLEAAADWEAEREHIQASLKKLSLPSRPLTRQRIWWGGVRKEEEVRRVTEAAEAEAGEQSRASRQTAELRATLESLEAALEAEKTLRGKAEKAKREAEEAAAETAAKVEEATSSVAAHSDISKRRDADMGRLRAELEAAKDAQESLVASIKKKHTETVTELNDQMDALHKAKNKSLPPLLCLSAQSARPTLVDRLEKEKTELSHKLDDAEASLDVLSRQKGVIPIHFFTSKAGHRVERGIPRARRRR